MAIGDSLFTRRRAKDRIRRARPTWWLVAALVLALLAIYYLGMIA